MTKRVQIFRLAGGPSQTQVGREGELIVDLSNFTIRVHDAFTAGGIPLARADLANGQLASASVNGIQTAANFNQVATNKIDIATNVTDIGDLDTRLTVVELDYISEVTSAANQVPVFTAAGQLVSSGLLVTDVGLPAGTQALFNQTAAPTGWTKLVVNNDFALRVVTGSVGSGGSVDFTTAFHAARATSAEANHSHTVTSPTGAASATIGISTTLGTDLFVPTNVHTHAVTTPTGAAGGHSHTSNLAVKYVDVIVASKD